MVRLGLRINRKRLENRIVGYWNPDSGQVCRAIDKALAATASKKAGIATTRRIVQRICREMYEADPAGFVWSVRKGLSPGFDVGEVVTYGRKGALRRGVIRTIGNVGAVVASLENPGVGYPIPGAYIHKLKKVI
jgi:hypothetical protein